jgi:hypothetical protein
MATRPKYARRIVVDGTVYYWRVPHRPNYNQAAYGTALTFSVWKAGVRGSPLHMHGGARPDNWLGLPGDTVTPARVAAGIRAALAAGWKPVERGPAFRLALPMVSNS